MVAPFGKGPVKFNGVYAVLFEQSGARFGSATLGHKARGVAADAYEEELPLAEGNPVDELLPSDVDVGVTKGLYEAE